MKGNDVYEELDRPAYPGQLRSKSYQYLIEPQGNADPLWADRFRRYWTLQEKRFGLDFDTFAIVVHREDRVVTSVARVRRLLPGIRRPKSRHGAPEKVQ